MIKPNEKFEEKDFTGFTQNYKYDIVYEHGKSEGGGDLKITSTNLSLYEIYVILRAFYFDSETDILEFDKKGKIINIRRKDGGGGCEFTIKQVGNKIVIDGYCGC